MRGHGRWLTSACPVYAAVPVRHPFQHGDLPIPQRPVRQGRRDVQPRIALDVAMGVPPSLPTQQDPFPVATKIMLLEYRQTATPEV